VLLRFSIASLSLGTLVSPCFAHHNTSALFDMESEVSVEGTVASFDWKNPHVYVEVAAEDGLSESVVWRFEGRPLAFMRQLGWTRETLRPGDRVTVTANPSRRTSRRSGFLVEITVQGRDVPALRGPERQERLARLTSEGNERADSLSGTWVTVFTPESEWIDDPSKLPLTDAGTAAVEAYDEATMHPGLQCIPVPAPAMMLIPDVKSIELGDGIMWIRGEFDGTERTIYFDEREPVGRTVHGHSVAHWEGGALVIETRNFSDHTMGNAYALPSGSRKRLVERLQLEENGAALIYGFEVTDPEFLAEPVTGEARWVYRPGVEFTLTQCNVENSRRFLDD
jgi:Family of unknown function (DUF6152)